LLGIPYSSVLTQELNESWGEIRNLSQHSLQQCIDTNIKIRDDVKLEICLSIPYSSVLKQVVN
jgi:hypothetical protein